jgi:hypothetical protein
MMSFRCIRDDAVFALLSHGRDHEVLYDDDDYYDDSVVDSVVDSGWIEFVRCC